MKDTTAQLTDDFKLLINEKGQTYQKLISQTNAIKEKVEFFEQLTHKSKSLSDLIKEKEEHLIGRDKVSEIQKGLENIKVSGIVRGD